MMGLDPAVQNVKGLLRTRLAVICTTPTRLPESDSLSVAT